MRRDDLLVPITTHRPNGLVIGKQKNNIRPRVGCVQRSQWHEEYEVEYRQSKHVHFVWNSFRSGLRQKSSVRDNLDSYERTKSA
jgi:hypothetical protein